MTTSLATCGPSFEEIVEHFAPASYTVTTWVEELREFYRDSARSLDAPLELVTLMNFGYEIGTPTGEEGEPFESLEEFVENAHLWGINRWLTRAADFTPAVERVLAAVELAGTWWIPVIGAVDQTRANALEALLLEARRCVHDPKLSRSALETALATRSGLPPSRPPPAYVGHFCGAVMGLLEALVASPVSLELAESLSYAVVAPDGSRRSAAIAAVVEAV